MDINNCLNTGKTTPLYFVCYFILDHMNSVAISELNIIFDVFILMWSRKENDLILENVSVLVFRLVWKNQKMKPEIRDSVARENISPEVLVSPKSFLKIFRDTYVVICNLKIIYN